MVSLLDGSCVNLSFGCFYAILFLSQCDLCVAVLFFLLFLLCWFWCWCLSQEPEISRSLNWKVLMEERNSLQQKLVDAEESLEEARKRESAMQVDRHVLLFSLRVPVVSSLLVSMWEMHCQHVRMTLFHTRCAVRECFLLSLSASLCMLCP